MNSTQITESEELIRKLGGGVIRYRQKLQAAEPHLAVRSRCPSSQRSATALYIGNFQFKKEKTFLVNY